MPMISSTRHKMDRICPQGPRAAAECLKCSFTKGRKERGHVEREKGRKDGGITQREKQRLIQYPLSPDLRPISINGGGWYVES